MSGKKYTGRAASMPVGLAKGMVASIAVTLVGAAIAAQLLNTEMVQENACGYAVMITLLLASYLGTQTSQHLIKRQRLVVAALSAASYTSVLMSITALFFGGQFEAVGVTILLILCGSGTTLLTGTIPKRVGRSRKIRKANR